ncbi:heparinase II/III family protein [Thalassococcus sp. CAU 1522]|uniref:Heparinase II/III family protein n=1 Tax=Thalassococcus arenae TaxID=2851652 RepID=A0ABS6N807_9RHOB|nr:heparinase II/III family protein [Thalassococcus arenae]MBV2360134.1 heparinase II/III family protein [Thalassococcus arenae]
MAERRTWRARRERFLNGWHAWRSARTSPASGFVYQPEPKSVGMFARGRQLIAGNLMFAGHLVEARDAMLWDLAAPDTLWSEEAHGFGWLDDLAAVGDARARVLAQRWLWGWIDRYGRGQGAGWTPELSGRRAIRWIQHALFLLRGQDSAASHAYFAALSRQTTFLARRWKSLPPGLARFEALTGLLYSGLSLEGMERHVEPARKAIGTECARLIDAQGGLPTRDPEALMEVLTLLVWARDALEAADRDADAAHLAAIARIAPTLRSLRHADGALARFHGGGRGAEGRLDQALAASGTKTRRNGTLAMGFARLSAGRTSVIMDAAVPPGGDASAQAHASTLAFELTSGRRALIVNCGAGNEFGREWRRAGRATPLHSTLCLEGYSSARLAAPLWVGSSQRELLADGPTHVPAHLSHSPDGPRIECAHDGYVRQHGLTHARTLELSFDGRALMGEDFLVALDDPAKRRFDSAMNKVKLTGLPFQVHFHLHPEVDVALDMGGTAVSMALRSGEIWVFRFSGAVNLSLEPSVFLEKGRLRPRATKQIVLSGRAMEYATRVRWTLSKAQETATAVRDLAMDEVDVTI